MSAIDRLIYASRATPEAAGRFDASVAEIVAVSQRNNTAVGVTGLLAASDGWFLQALEGPRTAVSKVFARIAADSRHDGFEIIQAGPVEARLFGRWSMVARTLSPSAAPLLEAMAGEGRFDAATLDAGSALRLLMTLRAVSDGRLERVAG